MIILVADERDVMQYVAAPDPDVFIFLEKTEKPTTVVYDHVIGLADNVVAADGSAGIRICHDIFCRHLLKRFRKPIVSTSANIAGMPPPYSFDDISEEIKNGVDYIVQHRQDEVTMHQPSSVVRWKNGELEVLRP